MPDESSPPFFPKLFKVPLQAILIVPFVIQTVGTVGIVGYLSFRNGQKAVNDVAAELRNETSSRIPSENSTTQKTSLFLLEQFQDFQQIQGFQQLEFSLNGTRQFVQVTRFLNGRGIDWLVVVTVPESDFMGQINANTQSTILWFFRT